MYTRQLSARAGRNWLREAYLLYRKNPALLTSATMVYLLAALAVGALPVLGPFLLSLIQPTLVAMLANVSALVARGDKPERDALIARLRERQQPLLRLGILQVGASVLLFGMSKILELVLGLPTDAEVDSARDILALLLPLLVLMLPFMMAFWFAPLLVLWHDLTPFKAAFFSLVAVWRNKRAFLVLGINVILVLMVASLLNAVLSILFEPGQEVFAGLIQFALLMVFVPMMMSAAYISYRDVFSPAPDAAEPNPFDETESLP